MQSHSELAPEARTAELELRPTATGFGAAVDRFRAIRTQDEYLESGHVLIQCAEYIKRIDDPTNKLQVAKANAHTAWKALCDVLGELRKPADVLRQTIEGSRRAWEKARERERLEDERRQKIEQERIATQERERAAAAAAIEAWELAEAGAPADVVELARTAPAFVPPPPPPILPRASYVPKQDGISTAAKWKGVVVDVAELGATEAARDVALAKIEAGEEVPAAAARAGLLLLARAVLAGKVPPEAIEPNAKLIGNQAKQFNTSLSWPGVYVFDAGSTRVRAPK